VEKITLLRTGTPWIDLGVVSLWDYLESQHPKHKKGLTLKLPNRVQIELTPQELTFSGDIGDINRELSKCLDFLKNQSLGKSDLGRFYWTGIASVFTGQVKGQPAISGFFSLPKYAKKGICDFCGKESSVRKAGAAHQPLIVTSEKFSSFFSNLRGEMVICENCSLASKLTGLKLFFSQQIVDRASSIWNVSLIEGADLIKLYKGIRRFSSLFTTASKVANYPHAFYWTQYPLESFLDFLFSSWRNLSKEEDFMEDIGNKIYHVFSIAYTRKGGRNVDVKRYYILPGVEKTLKTFEVASWSSEAGKEYNALREVAESFHFRREDRVDTLLREDLSYCILFGAHIFETIERFLYKFVLEENQTMDGFKAYNFRLLVNQYEKEVMNMEGKVISDAWNVGTTLGRLAAENDDKGIFYTLRSTRTMDDFLEAINLLLIRHVDEIKLYEERLDDKVKKEHPVLGRKAMDEILKDITEQNWKRYRALVGIYAVLEYMEKKSKKEGGENVKSTT